MNNRLYSYLYLYLKDMFTLKTSSSSPFANLLMEKPGNRFAIAKCEKTPEEERNFKKIKCIFT